MKVKELIEELQKLDPESLCIYSVDDEGNDYQQVWHTPTPGRFIIYGDGAERDFVADYLFEEGDTEGVVAVCIN